MEIGDITGLNGVELQMVGLIRGYVNNILSGRAKSREIGLEWIYNSSTQVGQIDIHECCSILGLPVDLLRIRMQFELYKKSIIWDKVSCALPLVIQEEILFHHSKEIYNLASIIWSNPGINTQQFSSDLLDEMSKKHLVMQNDNHQVWLTCRNPVTCKNIHWSKCWSFYD